MGRRSLGSKSGLAGRGGGCGARTSDAISSQGTVKVAALPGGPGCLQRPLAPPRPLHPAWAARPGYAPRGACCVQSRTRPPAGFLFNSVSPSSCLFFFPVRISPSASASHMFFLFFPITVSPSLLIFPHLISFIPVLCTFFRCLFGLFSLFFLSASLFLGLFLLHFLCHLILPVSHSQPPKYSNSGMAGPCSMPWGRLALPSEGIEDRWRGCPGWAGPVSVSWAAGRGSGFEVAAPSASRGLNRIDYCSAGLSVTRSTGSTGVGRTGCWASGLELSQDIFAQFPGVRVLGWRCWRTLRV